MTVGRIAGALMYGLVLLSVVLMGAPAMFVLVIGVVLAMFVASWFIPGGAGAEVAANLARKLYDRRGWEANWSRNFESGARRFRRGSSADDTSEGGLPPNLLPDDLETSRSWMRTLASIRRLSEPEARPGRRQQRGT